MTKADQLINRKISLNLTSINEFRGFFVLLLSPVADAGHCKGSSVMSVNRSATFDSWVALMLSTLPGQTCDPRSYVPGTNPVPTCGSYASIPFFVTFGFLSGFLVGFRIRCE